MELEKALEAKASVIVIEPSKLGDETARWIMVGNCLHKTAVLAGLSCIVTGVSFPDKALCCFPLGFASLVCTSVYAVSWQFDPCCKYQVEHDARKLKQLPLHSLTSSSPVVLVRKDDSRRKLLHNTLAFASASYCVWAFYQWYFK